MSSNINLRRRGAYASLLLGSVFGPFAGGAFAQTTEPAAQPEEQRDVVIVTAQRRAQDVQDVPIAISVVSGDALAEGGVTTMDNIGELAPSVVFTQNNNDSNSNMSIRGIGTELMGHGTESSVAFLVDGVPFARQGQALTGDLVDIERIEILRGPQGTLFGKNASAGVINVITRDPTDTLEVMGRFTSGTGDLWGFGGTMSGPVAEGVGARLTLFANSEDGPLTNVFRNETINGGWARGARAKLKFEPVDTFDFTLIADIRESQKECCARAPHRGTTQFGVTPSPENRDVAYDAELYSDQNSWGVSGEANWDIADHVLTSITGFRRWDFANNIDADGTSELPGSRRGITSTNINGGAVRVQQWSQEVRIASVGNDAVDYVLGGYAQFLELGREFNRVQTLCSLATPVGAPCGAGTVLTRRARMDNSVNMDSYAVFGHTTWHMGPAFDLTTGLRFTRDELDFDFNRSISQIPALGGPLVASGSTSDEAVTGTLSGLYRITDDMNIYATYGHGYKGPGVDIEIGLTAAGAQDPYIDSEVSDTYEIGLKSILFDGKVTANLAVFRTEFDNLQANAFDPDVEEIRASNIPKVVAEGVELEVMGRIVRGLTFGGAISYSDPIIEEGFGECYAGQLAPDCFDGSSAAGVQGIQDLAGHRMPNSPQWRASLNGRYTFELPDNGGDIFMLANWRWQDEVQFQRDGDPNTVQDAYAITNLGVGYSAENYEFEVRWNNVFDQLYYSSMPAGGAQHWIPRGAESHVLATLTIRN